MLASRRSRRGGILLEFVLSVPFSLLLVLITLDVGRLILVNTALQDAVAVSARAGARAGIVGANPAGTGQPCATPAATGNPSYDAFCEAARTIPGARLVSFEITAPSPGASQSTRRFCTRAAGQIYVSVRASANVSLVTPGLEYLLGGGALPSAVRSTGTARCEVAR